MAGLYGLAAVSAAASTSPAAMARSDLAAVYTPAHGEFPADIVDFSASQLSLAIRLRTVSCEEVMRACLKHIHRYNPVYNALVALVDDDTLNLPVGFDADARPMGMQIMGPFGADADVFAFAAAYEAVTSFLNRRPVLTDSSGVETR